MQGTCGPPFRPGSSAARSWSAGGRPRGAGPAKLTFSCPPPARPPARERQGRRPPRPVRRSRATPSAPGGGLREPGLRSARAIDHLHPGRAGPAASRVPGTLAYLGCSVPGRGAALVAPAAWRASGARAAAGPLGGARSLDSFTASTPRRQPPRRDTPARAAAPAWRPPAPPCHSPGAHTPPAPLAPACTHAADHASLGFVSAHTHVLTQIPSLHPPSLAPFPPYFLEESPIQRPHFASLPRTNLHPFPSKPPPPPETAHCDLTHGSLPARGARESVFFPPTQENELCCPSSPCKGEMLLSVEGSNAFWG